MFMSIIRYSIHISIQDSMRMLYLSTTKFSRTCIGLLSNTITSILTHIFLTKINPKKCFSMTCQGLIHDAWADQIITKREQAGLWFFIYLNRVYLRLNIGD